MLGGDLLDHLSVASPNERSGARRRAQLPEGGLSAYGHLDWRAVVGRPFDTCDVTREELVAVDRHRKLPAEVEVVAPRVQEPDAPAGRLQSPNVASQPKAPP